MFEGTAIIPKESTVTEQIGELRVTFLSLGDSGEKSSIPDEGRKNQFRIIVGHCPMYAMAEQDADAELREIFAPVARRLVENEKRVLQELLAVQGRAVDVAEV